MAKPVTAAARPVQEFKTEMTTGMSAPPMGRTCKTPRSNASSDKNEHRTLSVSESVPTPMAAPRMHSTTSRVDQFLRPASALAFR